MEELFLTVHNQGKDFLVDSRDVARVFDLTHQHVREQIEEHEPEMTRLGVFRVETGKPLAGERYRCARLSSA